jgi:hypothetical protein
MLGVHVVGGSNPLVPTILLNAECGMMNAEYSAILLNAECGMMNAEYSAIRIPNSALDSGRSAAW